MIQEYTGKARYFTGLPSAVGSLLVAITCRVEGLAIRSLLDTASEWCVLRWETAIALGWSAVSSGPPVPLSSRFGQVEGWLERLSLSFPAEEGVTLEIEATWFISEDWPGPPVLGWKGCLERLRFALDPGEEWFYFAEL